MLTAVGKKIYELAKGSGVEARHVVMALKYLRQYGYLADLDGFEGLKKFQRVFGLVEDGILGWKTWSLMAAPRCGCPDFIDPSLEGHLEFQRMIEEARGRWNKKEITWAFHQYLPQMDRDVQNQLFTNAMDAWTDSCGLLPTIQVSNIQEADIVVSVGRGRRSNFDGPGGTLAWAQLPPGDDRQLVMKFDVDENFVASGGGVNGILYLPVATHEGGHLWGLDHSNSDSDLMAPFYNPRVQAPQPGDKSRMVNLYGPAENPPNPLPDPGSSGDRYVIEVRGSVTVNGRDIPGV